MKKRHAYLIMAHNEYELLKILISMLDHEGNDIYLHVDAKAQDFDALKEELEKNIYHARIYFAERKKITWGGHSQIWCELELLRMATQETHSYYHLLSGCDLPIKSDEFIRTFFEENEDKIFLAIDSCDNASWLFKVSRYHLLVNLTGRQEKGVVKAVNMVSKHIQQLIKVDRFHQFGARIGKGANWFSVPEDFAKYILEQENEIKKQYKYTLCADEIFMQTLLLNSPFADRHVNDCKRLIDWKRGTPYTFCESDLDELINSDALWARKFSKEVSGKLPEKIRSLLENVVMEK